MFRRIFILVFCLSLILSSLVNAEEIIPEDNPIDDEFAQFIIEDDDLEELPISLNELGLPKYLAAEVVDGNISLSWTNYTSVFLYSHIYKLEYQIDFKIKTQEWASENPKVVLPKGDLEIGPNGKSSITFNPKDKGLLYNELDIDNNNYGIRLRYLYTYWEDGEEKHIQGRFSSPINLGLQPYYQSASSWALNELDKAVNYGFITEKIRLNMATTVTREEFCEIVMKLYYELSDNTVTYLENPFIDVQNPEIIKAAKLGIVSGVGNGKFAPDNHVTRQEIAVMIKRVLALIYPNIDFNSYSNLEYLDKNEASSWAINELGFAIHNGIIQGTNGGIINPKGNSTREQATIMVLRTYEKFR